MKKSLLIIFTVSILLFSIGIVSEVGYSAEKVYAEKEAAKPSYKNRSEIPEQYKWKLEHIYPNQQEWEKDIKKAIELANKFAKYEGKLIKSQKMLKKAIDDYSNLMRVHDKAYVYAHMMLDANSSNAKLQDLADRADKMSVSVRENTSWLSPEIAELSKKKINTYLRDESLTDYNYFISNIIRKKSHTLSKNMEELLAQSSPLASTPKNIFEMLTKDIQFPVITDKDGKELELTRSNFFSYLENDNREVRKKAFQLYYETLKKYQDTFAQTLGGEVKGNNFYAKARKYESAMEGSLISNNVPTKVYDQLIETVNQHLPLMHRYMALKKKMLGVEELHMYDIYTPIVQVEQNYISFEEAKKRVIEGLKPLGEEYTSVLKKGFEEGWIDVYPTKDKRGGAYQWSSYDTHPYVLLNYEGTRDDVSTIAHELGHAMQSYYTNNNQPYISSGYPIFTAEVASTMNEQLLWHNEYNSAKTKQEKIYLLNQRLENFRTTLFRQTQFAEFEKMIHEKDQKGESLNAEALKKVYKSLNEKYYGPVMISDEEIAMEWARIPHFYSSFYVYQYATSFAASTALAKQVLEEGETAVSRIRNNFLSAGSSDDPISILKEAGVDMSTAAPIEETMTVFKETLDELEKLLSEE
ncbi:oligoendopeptidase F [Bacillus taeanensis]|uniref:Oligopeptidase F n=1 Tax=Bacillus taeanensis TaxID=273032 RepID=A0A366Y3H8_9BACI|nr:oligoendopeptidase F [Bacillus taeanensis]RBW70934.1 oligoendopeptidase F [Bacillus taeanensis]